MMGNLGKLAGHERMRRLIKRAGGLPKHAQQCPLCGGVVVIDDDQLRDNPVGVRSMRYGIRCKDHDCMSVQGSSVAWCVKQWIKDCDEAMKRTTRCPWCRQPRRLNPCEHCRAAKSLPVPVMPEWTENSNNLTKITHENNHQDKSTP